MCSSLSSTLISNPSIRTAQSKLAKKLNDINDEKTFECLRSLSQSQVELFRSMKTAKGTVPSFVAQSKDGDARSLSSRDSKSRGSSSSSSVSSLNNTKKKRPKSASELLKTINKLTKPVYVEPTKDMKASDPTLRYATFDDAKECTFKPKIHSNHGSSESKSGGGHGDDAKSSFIERQEAKERTRRADLEFAVGKAAYEKILDKKYCPSCGAKQSYDEVKEKRKKCPNCGVEYRAKNQFDSKASKQFFENVKKYAQKAEMEKMSTLQRLEEDFKRSRETQVFDRATGRVITVTAGETVKWTEERKQEFFERMEEQDERRKLAIRQIEQEAYQNHTFKPSLNKKRLDEDGNEIEDDDIGGGPQAFLRRLEEQMEVLKTKNPHKFREKVEVSTLTFRP